VNSRVLASCATVVVFIIPMSFGMGALAQSSGGCPDWSPKFDQIRGSKTRMAMESSRQRGWANLIAHSDPRQLFDQGNGVIRQLKADIVRIQQGVQQIGQQMGDGGNSSGVNDAICQSRSSAMTAYECQIMLDEDTILATQGSLEIARCITGYNGMIEDGPIGQGSLTPAGKTGGSGSRATNGRPPTTSNTDSSGSRNSHYGDGRNPQDRGSGSGSSPGVNDLIQTLNTPSRVQDLLSTLDTPSRVQDLLNTLDTPSRAQDLLNTLNTSNGASNQNGSWTDPLLTPRDTPYALRTNSSQSNQNGDNWKQLSYDILKQGVSNTGETGESVVQTFRNLDGWAQLSSSSANDQIEGATTILSGANDTFNTNPASKAVTGQAIGVINSVAQQEENIIGTLDRAMQGDASPTAVDSSLQGIQQAIGNALLPGSQYVNYLQNKFASVQSRINDCVGKNLGLIPLSECLQSAESAGP